MFLHASFDINPFVPNTPFLYARTTSENLAVFWCFQGVEKGCIGNEWFKQKNYVAEVIQNPVKHLRWCVFRK